LRLLGYDTIFFTGKNDSTMIDTARTENRIILTRDTHILARRIITSGEIKAILIKSDNINEQIKQVINEFNLISSFKPFTLCLEDNHPLEVRNNDDVRNKVPPYVWKTQKEYVQCPECLRIYWKGTHWEAMNKRLIFLQKDITDDNSESVKKQ
jgi:uncharacterized protein with PIN domain